MSDKLAGDATMRLINTSTLTLEAFIGTPPRYAILSHTWEEDEVSFQDFGDTQARSLKKGFAKIEMSCTLAREAGLAYAWVDTCCIDKTSSAELTEALNSMFQWYRNAEICYAWLTDLALPSTAVNNAAAARQSTTATLPGLEGCRWFTRGWTLQELIGPSVVEIYDAAWNLRGTKSEFSGQISRITNISEEALRNPEYLDAVPVAQLMSWAAGRQTTRSEDIAYCLLGLFGVHMPMLYGEGGEAAFLRLQKEIIQQRNDLTVFAWRAAAIDQQTHHGILATRPDDFAASSSLQPLRDPIFNASFDVTNKGIRVYTDLFNGSDGALFMPLGCYDERYVTAGHGQKEIGIWLTHHGGSVYSRIRAHELKAAESVGERAGVHAYLSARISARRSAELADAFDQHFVVRSGLESSLIEFPFRLVASEPPDLCRGNPPCIVAKGSAAVCAYLYFEMREDVPAGRGMGCPAGFYILFGRGLGEQDPWCGAAKGNDGLVEDLAGQEPPAMLAALSAARADYRLHPNVDFNDEWGKLWKAVTVKIETIIVGARVTHFVDVTMGFADTRLLMLPFGAANSFLNPENDEMIRLGIADPRAHDLVDEVLAAKAAFLRRKGLEGAFKGKARVGKTRV